MKSIDEWLEAYGRDHKNPTNKIIHKFCVPLIMFSLLGLFWEIPVSPLGFNIALWFTALSLLFYLKLDFIYFLIMTVVSSAMLYGAFLISPHTFAVQIYVFIFVTSWIGQFIGHKIEGQKPSFFEDLQFLFIGPLWVFKGVRDKLSFGK